ncbi:hypothetical protein JCM33374_g535 [Metschnikowia sp. JCM 33374]|nr:hypothetical protein JCM33374_g535 [Metschnikowia sp. JCM 33374]
MFYILFVFQSWLTLCFSHIIEVSTVEEIIAKPISLIYFYDPGCQFCQAFSEDFEYISHIYNPNPSFQVIQINGRHEKQLKDLFEIQHFPTLKLYDDEKKRITTFTETRSVENLHKFIEAHTSAHPDTSKLSNNIRKVSKNSEIDELKSNNKSVLIAFAGKSDETWQNYHYPNHFYQSLATRYPDTEFTVKFIEDAGSELMQTYHISNVPSLVFIEGDQVGVFNSLSTKPMINYKLDANSVVKFLDDFTSRKEGVWFESIESLALHTENTHYVGHLQRKSGMNYVEGHGSNEMANLGLDEQYQILLDKISL